MYYQSYEDYMRNILGYPTENRYTYDNYMVPEERFSSTSEEAEQLYPEIYKTINPLVCRECDGYTGPITNEAIESMVDRIYSNIEINNEIMIKINVDNRSLEDRSIINSKENENRNSKEKIASNNSKITNNELQKNRDNLRSTEVENRQRRPNNPLLRDLIRILILNRLFGGGFFPGRPPRPRPPFPGPGRPPVRPPFPGGMPPRPRNYNDYLEF